MITPDYTTKTFSEATNLSTVTIWRLIKAGKVAAYKVGRSVRIPHEELDRFRESNRIRPGEGVQ